jgi:hypothetical protein
MISFVRTNNGRGIKRLKQIFSPPKKKKITFISIQKLRSKNYFHWVHYVIIKYGITNIPFKYC